VAGNTGILNLITHVAVGKMNVHDQDALLPAISDTQARGVGPVVLLADTHYGSENCVKEAASFGVEVLAPVNTAKGKKQGKLTLEDFELDTSGLVIRCPQGQEPVETSVTTHRLQVRFDSTICGGCALSARCPAFERKRLQYSHGRVRNRVKRLIQNEAPFRDQYRWRAGVEATMSRYKHQMNMAHLRVRGLKAIRYHAFLRALGLNIRRAAVERVVAS